MTRRRALVIKMSGFLLGALLCGYSLHATDSYGAETFCLRALSYDERSPASLRLEEIDRINPFITQLNDTQRELITQLVLMLPLEKPESGCDATRNILAQHLLGKINKSSAEELILFVWSRTDIYTSPGIKANNLTKLNMIKSLIRMLPNTIFDQLAELLALHSELMRMESSLSQLDRCTDDIAGSNANLMAALIAARQEVLEKAYKPTTHIIFLIDSADVIADERQLSNAERRFLKLYLCCSIYGNQFALNRFTKAEKEGLSAVRAVEKPPAAIDTSV